MENNLMVKVNRKEKVDINYKYLEVKSLCDLNRSKIMANQEELDARGAKRTSFKEKLRVESNQPDEIENEGVIYYRWHYGDGSEDDGIQEVANKPSVRWLLYTTGIENPGMFFYSINQQDLVVNPLAGTPRIGPYARPVPAKGSLTMTSRIGEARRKIVKTFEDRLATAEKVALQNNQPAIGKIHYRWHYTDVKNPIPRPISTRDNTQAVRDVLTEFRVKYPNQLWVSCNLEDMQLQWRNLIYRPEQGTITTDTSIVGSTASATVSSAAASASTAGTGHTHPAPSPLLKPKTKKVKSAPSQPPSKPRSKPIFILPKPPNPPATTNPSVHLSGPSGSGQDIAKSKPSSTVSVAPVGPSATTTSGQDMAQTDTLQTFIASFNPLTDSSPVDTDASLSAAANPVPSAYLDPGSSVQVIPPDSGIAETSSEETVQAIDASQLTAQPIGALTAGTGLSSGSLLAANDPNDPNFGLQFLNLPTSGTPEEQDEEEDQNN